MFHRGGPAFDAALEADAQIGSLKTTGDGAPAVEPKKAFLQEVRVRGFRGIGPEATLAVNPGPGLTLVVGRNGCGKSSFAEAAELLHPTTGHPTSWSADGTLLLDAGGDIWAVDPEGDGGARACTAADPFATAECAASEASL